MNNNTKGFIYTIFGAICWGFSGFCSDYLFSVKNLSPLWVAPVRLLSASLILFIISLISIGKQTFEPLKDKKDILRLINFGTSGLIGAQFTYLMAIANSNAATATVLQYLGISFLVIYVCIRNLRFPSGVEIVSLIFAMIGTFLITTHGDIHSLSITTKALFWGLLGGVGLVTYSLTPVKLLKKYNCFCVLSYAMFVGGVVLTLILKPWKFYIQFDIYTFLAMVGLVVFGTVIAFFMYMTGVNLIGPVNASLLNTFEPLSAILFSVMLLNLKLKFVDFLGFALIISTVFILKIKTINKR
ncbi:MAG: EamA family transporter [Peptoniphilaceae bacterium]|uniref:DMT family transporter n=1 Tax=Parvimonas sp. TaxID=1944660 RepID=UPI0025EFA2A1|nr:EamA family transporter [Parvimonas sp.]MCI5997859.1 EamA family transporter [Parvimonas sp.]MDD7764568.1 EamA family transporter [Peptoniphilaceae bacterium]MDY3050546.1 EamA family transporter [Parvimonas sp.]